MIERLRDALEFEQVRRRRLHGLGGSFAESGGAISCTAALVANRASRPPLPDQPLDERDQRPDVGLVDDPRSGVDVQPGELVDLRQACLENRQVALQPLLLVEDQVGPAALDRVDRGGRQVEPGDSDVVRALVRRLQIRLAVGGQPRVGDASLTSGCEADVRGEGRDARSRVGVRLSVDLDVVDLQPGLLQSVDRSLRAHPRRLGRTQTIAVALLQVQLGDGRLAEQDAGVVEVLSDVAEAGRLVRVEERRQLGVRLVTMMPLDSAWSPTASGRRHRDAP